MMVALGRLPQAQRVAIVLHHLADPVDQVAAETGSSVSAVKKQLIRGRAAMAEYLSDDDRVRRRPRGSGGRAMTDLLTQRLHDAAERIPVALRPASETRRAAEHARRRRMS